MPHGRLTLIAAVVLAACSQPKSLTFPKNFVFGVATAGFQNEMGCPTIPESQCADPNSDWYQWITTPSIAASESITGGPPSTGPGWFELYPSDLALAKNGMHVTAVRTSIEWSRIFPTSTVGVQGYASLKAIASPAGIAFYHALFAQMKADGLTPLVTINHYTLPIWLHDGVECNQDNLSCTASGWLNPQTVTEIAKYAGFVAQEYGDQVDLWATLNEPLAVPLSGYLDPGPSRTNPPGVSLHAAAAKTVIMNEIEAHAQMYDAVKANDLVDADGDGVAAEVGLVDNLSPVYPADASLSVDVQAAQNTQYLYDELFLNAVIKGELDANATGASTAVSRPDLARMDFLGVNYYNRINVAGLSQENIPFPTTFPLLDFDPTSSATNFYVIYTRGIYEMVQWVEENYDKIPIYITENGTSQGADDPTAPGACVQYLEWLQKAISEGANVRGYFWWTLTDNYEWNHGMTYHFGLYAVDSTQTSKPRTIRPVGETYAQIVQAREIPAALAKANPIE